MKKFYIVESGSGNEPRFQVIRHEDGKREIVAGDESVIETQEDALYALLDSLDIHLDNILSDDYIIALLQNIGKEN